MAGWTEFNLFHIYRNKMVSPRQWQISRKWFLLNFSTKLLNPLSLQGLFWVEWSLHRHRQKVPKNVPQGTPTDTFQHQALKDIRASDIYSPVSSQSKPRHSRDSFEAEYLQRATTIKAWPYLVFKCNLLRAWHSLNIAKHIAAYLLSDDGRLFGGSILIAGSHSPGGRTMTSSRNSSMPAIRSCLSFAL